MRISELIPNYLEELKILNRSPLTIRNIRGALNAMVLLLPKQPKRLPKVILEYVEITKIMAAPDMRTHAGYRNRIILEILYDTGYQGR
jgi:site-specific recombinase XerD